MELRRGLRCATSERKIGVFAEFMKYAGKFLRKLILRDFFGLFWRRFNSRRSGAAGSR
jgi:hypothetical protein